MVRQTTDEGHLAWEHPLEKLAPSTLPIDERIRARWSPRAFSDRGVEEDALLIMLEAARWAPSSFNEQPWRFIVAKKERPDEFETMLSCLTEGNRSWASGAPVLMLTAARTSFSRDGRENRHGYHDLGLAMGNLLMQATSMNLYVHQMAGIDPRRARQVYEVPEEFDVVAAAAIGFLGDPESLDDPRRRKAETEPRSRRPLTETVFEGAWGRPASWISSGKGPGARATSPVP